MFWPVITIINYYKLKEEMKFKNYLLLLLITLLPAISGAQSTTTSLCYNIPGDSLMFMLYINKDNVEDEVLLKETIKEMPDQFKRVAENFREFCFYGQTNEAYDSYRIDFKSSGTIAADKMTETLKEFNFTIKDFSDGMVILDGGQYSYGYFIKGSEYSTLKIYNQTTVVNKKLRKEFEEARLGMLNADSYHDDDYRIACSMKLDSISRLDSVVSKNYFENLLSKEQQRLANGEDIQAIKSPFKMKSYMKNLTEGKAVVAYVDAKYISRVPYYLYNSLDYQFYEFMENFEQMSTTFMLYDKMWLSAAINTDNIEIESLLENSKGNHYSYKLDKNIIKYLPLTAPESFAIYNTNISDIKTHLLESFYFPEMNNEERGFAKMALLAIDDDILRSIGNGFIAINKGEVVERGMPDFKMVFELPNLKKGQLLMKILCQEFDVFWEVDKNVYVVKKSRDSEEQINICITDNVWIMGTAPVEELKQVNTTDKIKVVYPMFSDKKMVQYAKISEALLGSSDDMFKTIEIRNHLLKKKVLKSKITLRR